MLSLQYFFDPYPLPFIASGRTIVLAAIGASAGLALVLFIIARIFKHAPPRRRFVMRVVQWCAATALVILLLYFFRQQRVYVLAAPVVALLSCAGLAAWLVWIFVIGIRRMKEEEKVRAAQELRARYLPH